MRGEENAEAAEVAECRRGGRGGGGADGKWQSARWQTEVAERPARREPRVWRDREENGEGAEVAEFCRGGEKRLNAKGTKIAKKRETVNAEDAEERGGEKARDSGPGVAGGSFVRDGARCACGYAAGRSRARRGVSRTVRVEPAAARSESARVGREGASGGMAASSQPCVVTLFLHAWSSPRHATRELALSFE